MRGASNGSTDVGHELDLTLAGRAHEHVKVSGGLARLWGGDVFDGQSQENALLGHVQVALSY